MASSSGSTESRTQSTEPAPTSPVDPPRGDDRFGAEFIDEGPKESLARSKERWIAAQIRQRVLEHNLNAIAIWVGPTGSGKSYSALRLAELVDPDFGLAHLAFSAENFLDLVNEESLQAGQVIVWDEVGLGMPAREWQSIFNKSVGYILQSFRFKRIALFMTVPDQGFIDTQARRLFHYLFECVSIDRIFKRVVAKPFFVQHSPRFEKDYPKYPRVKLPTGSVKMGSVSFAMPSKDLRDSYERKRRSYMDDYYRDLRDSLTLGGHGGDVPAWAWRAILELAVGRNQAELAGILQVSREWANKLLGKARVAVKGRATGS